jgi:hypothetical protein
MQHLLTNISKKVGAVVGWRGAFWERRYSAEPVLDDEALLGRIRYIFSHGVKEGLVPSCLDWPGLTSLAMMLDREPRFRWFSWSDRWKWRRNRKPCPRFDERCSSDEKLVLTPVPHPAFRDPDSRRRIVEQLIESIEEHWRAVHHNEFRGRAWVLAQRPQHRPERPARSPRPLCHASSKPVSDEFREKSRGFMTAFLNASQRWRSGDFSVQFPLGANRPMVAHAA